MNRWLTALLLTAGTASTAFGQSTACDGASCNVLACDATACGHGGGGYAGMMTCQCVPAQTVRVVEGVAWKVIDEPVCIGGCATQGCLGGNHWGSCDSSCDAQGTGGCDAAGCDTCANGADVRYPLLGKLGTAPRVRSRAKLMRRTVVHFEPRVEFYPNVDSAGPCACHLQAATDYHPVQLWLDRFQDPEATPMADVVESAPDDFTEGAVVRWLDVQENPADEMARVNWEELVESVQAPAPIDRAPSELPPVIRATSLLPAPSEIVPAPFPR